MQKIIPLSLVTALYLSATDIQLEPISVESSYVTEIVKEVQDSSDVAYALQNHIPSIDMNRRSGIANDIIIRGQKRDNISFSVDGVRVCGACPNRMDPPVSHVLASQIQSVEVIEGPYDVENFGTMSGGVKITTKKPSKKLFGEIEAGIGSFGYKKVGATISGGNDVVRLLLSATMEKSAQYKDGNGDTMSQQTANTAEVAGNKYMPKHSDMDSYSKKSAMLKAYIKTFENHELKLNYTLNRSDDVLYPNTPMDANADDSDIYSAEYIIKNLTNEYEQLSFNYYNSQVIHPMSTEYRNAPMKTNSMKSSIEGFKVKSLFNLFGHTITAGLDGSKRRWSGEYIVVNQPTTPSIAETTTTNKALFVKAEKIGATVDIALGFRYDDTEIESKDKNANDSDYNSLNANIIATYKIDDEQKMFIGLGQSSRVPDARELYFRGGKIIGTPSIKKTTNREIDIGYEITADIFDIKVKGFYSDLKDYIYYQKISNANRFHNIDATIYGLELTNTIYATDELTLDMSASYKVGKKDSLIANQTDKDLADIAPLRTNIGAKYEYLNNSYLSVNLVSSKSWSNYDSDNGEQKLSGWSVLNTKVQHSFSKNIIFSAGVNNIFDKTYTMSNTYADITLIAGNSNNNVSVLNEVGRYMYSSVVFKF